MNTKMTFDSEFEIRPMREADNKSIACYIRAVIDEHKASRTNSVYDDPTTDCVFQTFEGVNAQYWVLDHNGSVVGGCGYFPTNGLPLGCAEIVKFYILPEARGHNYGATLLDLVINQAKKPVIISFISKQFRHLPKRSICIANVVSNFLTDKYVTMDTLRQMCLWSNH